MSLGSSAECEPLKPFIQILQAGRRSRGATGGQRRAAVTRAPFGLVCTASMQQGVGACAGSRKRR